MDTNTNRKKNKRRNHDSRQRVAKSSDAPRPNPRRGKRRSGFWEAIVNQPDPSPKPPPAYPSNANPPTASQTQSDPNSEDQTSNDTEATRPPATPANADDVCQVTKSIEAVFVSKTEARKQKALVRERNLRYQDDIRRPIICLIFVLPLLFFYELGSILLGHQSLRSGIDQWFHQPLYQLGFGGLVVLPIVTIAVLIFWHHQRDDHWNVRPANLFGMLLEAIGLGLILFWAANAINQLVGGASLAALTTRTISDSAWWANIVACVGSGIYEELIFRIGLLTLLTLWAQKLIPDRKSAAIVGVIAVSLLFSALHYSVFNPAGNPFEMSSFVFRFFASIVFCILFLFRGFGIAVGAHVAYDVLTQI